MGPPKTFGKGGGGGGGKKGPRAHLVSHKNQQVKLRPAPEKPFVDATDSTKTSDAYPGEQSGTEDEDDEEQFGYSENLQVEVKPLAGAWICVTGCGEDKSSLLDIASELGALVENGLTDRTTHLIASESGSAKYEAAVKYKMKIMLPSWLPAIRESWTRAEPTNTAALERAHRMKPLANLTICLTGFARGHHKDAFKQFLVKNGAAVSPALTSETTHLVVASSQSPHSQDNHNKLDHLAKGHWRCKTVWEGWTRETVAAKGIVAAREVVWRWREGGSEPTAAQLFEEPMMRDSKKPMERHETVAQLGTATMVDDIMRVHGGEARKQDRDEKGEAIVVASRRSKARIGKDETAAVDSLLSDYNPTQSTSRLTSNTDVELLSRIEATLPSTNGLDKGKTVDLRMELVDDFSRPGAAGGKSVIKAMSTARSTSFHTSTPAPPRTLGAPRPFAPPQPDPTPADASMQDDSAFFESEDVMSKPESSESEERPRQIFVGHTFAIMGMGRLPEVAAAAKAIVERGGQAWIEEREEEAQWICVPIENALPQYRDSRDPRIVTIPWLERCLHDDEVRPPTGSTFETPFPYDVPVPGGANIKVCITGTSPIDFAHIRRYVKSLGGEVPETFNKTCSHLIHATLDDDPSSAVGIKVDKARKWGIPVMGLNWLVEFGARAAEKRDGEAVRKRTISKGKGKEVLEDSSSRSRSRTASVRSGILSECTVLISSKFKYDRHQLGNLITSAGGTVAVAFSTDVTHLAHIGKKSAESFAEFKSAKKAGIAIVHPRWVEESISNGKLASEGDFPHTYDAKKGGQLAAMISSPPHAGPAPRKRSVATPVPTVESKPIVLAPIVEAKDRTFDIDASTTFGPTFDKPPPPRMNPHAFDDVADLTQPTANQESTLSFGHLDTVDASDHFGDMRAYDSFAVDRPVVGSSSDTHVVVEVATSSPAPSPIQAEVEAPGATLAPIDPQDFLKRQTSVLLANLGNSPPRDSVGGKRKSRIGRKRSTESINSRSNSVVLPPPDEARRRLPGQGLEPTQFTQYEEDSMDVIYDDQAAAKARLKVFNALNGAGGRGKRTREEEGDTEEEESQMASKRGGGGRVR